MMRRMVDPGLPSNPVLYFDAECNRAYVSTKVIDWRAVERSYQLTHWLLWPFFFLIAYWAWIVVPHGPDVIYRFGYAFMLFALMAALLTPAYWFFLPRCLSSLLFSRRVTFIVTGDAIGFRSWFYDNGVRITRSFRGASVIVKVAMRKDAEAEDHSEYVSIQRPGKSPRTWPKSHLRHARKLELVICSGAGDTPSMASAGVRRLRTLPVATLPASHGETLTVVLNAAIALTQSGSDTGVSSSGTIGMDLDRPLSSGER